jgi:hypothetical protein
MDPYLEHPAVFPGLHSRLITALSESLQDKLPPPYYAEIGERVWVEVSQRFIEPDATVLRRDEGREPGAGPVATAASRSRSRSVLVTVPHDERREPYVEILCPGPGDGSERLVTALELLSPTNKTNGERGRDLYLRKQRELLESTAHLVEIDLLRGGVHTTAVPLEQLSAQVGPFDYHISVHRADRFEQFLIYPVRLDEPLPEVAVPLLAGDPDVLIDLQALFDHVYDTGPYRRRIRYAESHPIPPLRPDLSEWAARIVANRGG